MNEQIDLPIWVPSSFALVGAVVLTNAALMHRLRADAAEARRQWLISGARNVASWRALRYGTDVPKDDSGSGAPYSMLEPVPGAGGSAAVLAGLLYMLLTGVIGYAIFAANDRAATVLSNADFLGRLWTQAREVLFFAFVGTYFSGVVIVNRAAANGILDASTFVRATTHTILACVASVLVLLVKQILAPGAVASGAIVVEVDLAWRVVFGLALVLGCLPLLVLIRKHVVAAAAMGRIEGLSFADRLLLAAHGFGSVAELAVANPARLYVTSGIDAYRLVDSLAQAQVAALPSERVGGVGSFRTIFDMHRLAEHDVAMAIESSPTFMALMQFQKIISSPGQELSPGTPAVLGGLLEQSVTKAVEEAMFGDPKVRYSGWVRFELVAGELERRFVTRAFTAKLRFAGTAQSEHGWTRLDILDGLHQDLVDFRVRFDSDATGFNSVESSVRVPTNGAQATCEAELSVKMETLQHVWATIIQGSRTIQVIELPVPQSEGLG